MICNWKFHIYNSIRFEDEEYVYVENTLSVKNTTDFFLIADIHINYLYFQLDISYRYNFINEFNRWNQIQYNIGVFF